ncbi:SDR family oxidoreductase [Mycolicibacterium porcinum]|uniref:NAD(P)H-binding protein n=1 Tax=Mycolicibacterium porcinum TaxID=39693 RepID=A0AAW5T3Z9_9MYCO|nr:NAD(P)H-binding protein [Mycolicibacterium porcinum]MCV7389492.1 NAD(P)H-binding protein [Mycolicibacterium porcinum]ORB44978.1 NmrA family transcriptional regulator [Mycolicibacterium porcinum]CDO27592.1 dTDP-4-dehydrorhamnose reductase [Mycolicibacterium vulneris]
MRIAVAGSTGNIGARVVAALRAAGHEVVPISRSSGVDLSTGAGLDAALAGVQAVVDAISAPPTDRDSTVDYLGTATRNLLAAEGRAGVGHHVLLSIVGIHGVDGNPHYAGKREQERLIEAGSVPWTIVPATQFHDFAEMVVSWTERDGRAEIAPLLIQPIDPDDVAAVLAEIVAGDPQGRYADVAGPQTQDLVDLARRTLAARGRDVTLVPTWSSIFGVEMAGNALLPGAGARIAPTTFDQWLSRQR